VLATDGELKVSTSTAKALGFGTASELGKASLGSIPAENSVATTDTPEKLLPRSAFVRAVVVTLDRK
jgi:hypothetical protein